MEKEQIIKALECCSGERDLCAECPVDKRLFDEYVCGSFVMGQALQLIGSLEQIIFELENRLKECENGYSQTLALERAKVKELAEVNERLVLAAKMAGVPLPEGLDIINKFCSGRIIDVTKNIFAEINSSLAYVEEQLDEVPDCFLAVKEDIEYLEKKYVEGKSD